MYFYPSTLERFVQSAQISAKPEDFGGVCSHSVALCLLQKIRKRKATANYYFFLIWICVNSNTYHRLWWESRILTSTVLVSMSSYIFSVIKMSMFCPRQSLYFAIWLEWFAYKGSLQQKKRNQTLKCQYFYWFKKSCVCTLHFRRSTSLLRSVYR